MTATATAHVQTPTRSVPIGTLVLELTSNGTVWRNPRQFTGLAEEDIKALADEIHQNGLMTPVLVERFHVADKQINLVADGQRRVLALRHLISTKRLDPLAHVQVVDLHPEPVAFTKEASANLLLDALASASYREPLTSYEQTEAALIARAGGKSQNEIALRLGRSKTWVSRMLAARDKASEQVIGAWKEGKITDEQFKELAEVPPAKQPEAVGKIVELRERGERSLARMEAKEAVPTKAAKEDEPPAKPTNGANGSNGHAKPAPVPPVAVKPAAAPPPVKVEAPAKPRSTHVADLVRLRSEHPAKDPYMMGVLDCAAFLAGQITESGLRKPYHQYLAAIAKGPQKPGPKAAPKEKKVPVAAAAKPAKAPPKKKAAPKAKKASKKK